MRDYHPIEQFRLILRDDATESLSEEIVTAVSELATARKWVISPPVVDMEPGGAVVVVLDIYSAREPWNKYIPIEVDRAHFQEVRDLIMSLSKIESTDWEAHLGDVYVGRIFGGQPDTILKEGLLEPWEQTTRGG